MKVLVFGSLNIDYVYSVNHFVRPGETLSADDRQIFSGGKGLNQAIALQNMVWKRGMPALLGRRILLRCWKR